MNEKSPGLSLEKEYKWLAEEAGVLEELKGRTEIGGLLKEKEEEFFQKDFYFYFSLNDGSYLRVREIERKDKKGYFLTCKGIRQKQTGPFLRVQREFSISGTDFEFLVSHPEEVYQFRDLANLPIMAEWRKLKINGLPIWVLNLRTEIDLSLERKKGRLYLDRIMFTNNPGSSFKPTEFEIEFEPTSANNFDDLIKFIESLPGVTPALEAKVGRYLKSLEK